VAAGADELFGRGQRIGEAGAHRLQVEGRAAVGDAQARLQQRRGAREDVVGRRRGDDDQVDVGGLMPAAAMARRLAS
jgi:hypothetical protein